MLALIGTLGEFGFLLGDTLAATPRALLSKRGRGLAWRNLWAQMDRVGVRSIPIVALVLYCIGAIISLQFAPTLKTYGIVSMVADVVSIATFRELGPLVSAIVLTGYAGAAIAAEIGSMVVSEEIEAMEASAISPVRLLVVPRVIASVVMTVCVAMVGDLMGILGGLTVARLVFGIHSLQYLAHTFSAVNVGDILTGLLKAAMFGACISLIACFMGTRVTGGAQGVGVATSKTVVYIIVSLILVDLAFTTLFFIFHV